MIYWAIFDRETQKYLHTGRNSLTKEAAILDGFDYLVEGSDYTDEEVNSFSSVEKKAELLQANDFVIEFQNVPFDDY